MNWIWIGLAVLWGVIAGLKKADGSHIWFMPALAGLLFGIAGVNSTRNKAKGDVAPAIRLETGVTYQKIVCDETHHFLIARQYRVGKGAEAVYLLQPCPNTNWFKVQTRAPRKNFPDSLVFVPSVPE